MSQDNFFWFSHLTTFLPDLESSSAAEYFASEAALESGSTARALVESGRTMLHNLDADDVGKILFAAVLLGGTTLSTYLKVMTEFKPDKRTKTAKKLF